MASARVFCQTLPFTKFTSFSKMNTFSLTPSSLTFSTTPTPYPLQYEMIINRPAKSVLAHPRRRPVRQNDSNSESLPESDSPEESVSELGLDSWVDKKLASEKETDQPSSQNLELDKAKRKYYRKRRKRMYGSDSDEENRRPEEKFVELKPEVVELPTLHKREEELYFYDTFSYPWEKEKHYKMVYQLEKKYFPDQCLDKAFLEPGESNTNVKVNADVKSKLKEKKKVRGDRREKKYDVSDERDDKKLTFFDEKEEEKNNGELVKDAKKDLTEKKVEEFFKYLKKAPNKDVEVGNAEPYLVSRSTGLPPTWDGPHGAVVLVNKPKGELTSWSVLLFSTSHVLLAILKKDCDGERISMS